jgi:transposase
MEYIEEVYHDKIKASKADIYEACEGVVTEHHVFMLQTIKKDILFCEALISTINLRIKNMLAPYENVVELLKEVPGLSTKSIEDLIAEIGLDMSVFPTDKHLASWSGVAPGNNESGGKKKVVASHTATSK